MAYIFDKLAKHKSKKNYLNTEDYIYFKREEFNLLKLKSFFDLNSISEYEFKIVVSNIIIKAIDNKKTIEGIVELYQQRCFEMNLVFSKEKCRLLVKEELEKMRYFETEGVKIYIPIFTRAMNIIYTTEPEKLLEYPYNELKDNFEASCLDMFDLYGYELFHSSFTHLNLIKKGKTSAMFYHFDFETLFVINDQGRLDLQISLFDDGLKIPNKHHILRKLEEVANAFYSNDRDLFINTLLKNGFISDKMHNRLYKGVIKRLIRRVKIFRKVNKKDEKL